MEEIAQWMEYSIQHWLIHSDASRKKNVVNRFEVTDYSGFTGSSWPQVYLETIFEIVHFPTTERQAFLDAYGRAHPGRLQRAQSGRRNRTATLHVPDLGDEDRNRRLDHMLSELAVQIAKIIDDGQ